MSDLPLSSPISLDEMLARFVMRADWIRSDETIRQDAFIPPKDRNLSVTRHTGITEEALWGIGRKVAEAIAANRPGSLVGRADIAAIEVSRCALSVQFAPILDNPNHAHITGWPEDKPAQKQIAQRLAAASKFFRGF